MRQADVVALSVGALFVIWLVRTGRASRVAGTSSDPVIQAFEATGSTGAFPVAFPSLTLPRQGATGAQPLTLPSQKGKAIAERARAYLGAPTSQFNAQYPRRACASYVSSVLVSLGLLDAKDPRCSSLITKLPGKGAQKVGSGPVGDVATQIGDLIFFRDSSGRLKHVEIAGDAGSSIGTSSSQQKVGERPIGARGYPWVDVFRF